MNKLSDPRARFVIPALLGAIQFAGLLSALLGDGAYDFFSWFALSIPLVAIAACLLASSNLPDAK